MLIVSHQEHANTSHSEMPACCRQGGYDEKDVTRSIDEEAENLEPSHPAAGDGIIQLLWETNPALSQKGMRLSHDLAVPLVDVHPADSEHVPTQKRVREPT